MSATLIASVTPVCTSASALNITASDKPEIGDTEISSDSDSELLSDETSMPHSRSKSSSRRKSGIRSKSKSPSKYPHLKKFVKRAILPSELSKNDKVVEIYVKIILKNLHHYPGDLNGLIYGISPFPGWIDSGASNVWNGGWDQLKDMELDKDLKSALRKDGIK